MYVQLESSLLLVACDFIIPFPGRVKSNATGEKNCFEVVFKYESYNDTVV
jgi:hypothetical protein